MAAHQPHKLDQTFEQIEETILPSLSMMLDTLLDAASLARPGKDADAYAAELRSLASQLGTLTQQVEAITSVPQDPRNHDIASAA